MDQNAPEPHRSEQAPLRAAPLPDSATVASHPAMTAGPGKDPLHLRDVAMFALHPIVDAEGNAIAVAIGPSLDAARARAQDLCDRINEMRGMVKLHPSLGERALFDEHAQLVGIDYDAREVEAP